MVVLVSSSDILPGLCIHWQKRSGLRMPWTRGDSPGPCPNMVFRRQNWLDVSHFLMLEKAFYPVDHVKKEKIYFAQSVQKCKNPIKYFLPKTMGAIYRDIISVFFVQVNTENGENMVIFLCWSRFQFHIKNRFCRLCA